METGLFDNLIISSDIVVTSRLNYKRLHDIYGDEGDIVFVVSRDPDNPNRTTVETRLPNVPIREMPSPPKPREAEPLQPTPKSLFDLEHPLSEIPQQTELPLDPIADTGNRDMQEPVLEFPRERIALQRTGTETIKGRFSESEWYLFRETVKAQGEGVDFDILLEVVPDWNEDTQYNCVYQMISGLNAKLERLGFVYHVRTEGFIAFLRTGKKPLRNSVRRRKR